jgi:hypothetical protein
MPARLSAKRAGCLKKNRRAGQVGRKSWRISWYDVCCFVVAGGQFLPDVKASSATLKPTDGRNFGGFFLGTRQQALALLAGAF